MANAVAGQRARNDTDQRGRQRRRKIIRTAVILAVVVVLIYAIFVGKGVWSYFTS